MKKGAALAGPAIKPAQGRTAVQKGVSDAVAFGTSSLLSSLSAAVEIAPHSRSGLLRVLHVRLHEAEAARNRSRWILGRLYNRRAGVNGDFVPMSGTHLRQTLAIAGLETPGGTLPSGQYLLKVDIAEKARTLLAADFGC